MDFGLSKEHVLLKRMLEEFAENEVKPIAADVDEEEKFPWETIKTVSYTHLTLPTNREV